MDQQKKERIKWIDCAKMMAMIAVLVDHSYRILYSDKKIAWASLFSVTLFVVLSGMSFWESYDKKKQLLSSTQKSFSAFTIIGRPWMVQRITKLFIQYALATLIIQIYYKNFFDVRTYIVALLNFTTRDPYYFFVFFFQLIIISPLLIWWYEFCNRKKYAKIWHMFTLVLLGIVAAVCINYTYVLPVWGGGQYLFGGTYLLVYYSGILLAASKIFDTCKKYWRVWICSAILWIFWWLLRYIEILPFDSFMVSWWGNGYNPPSIELMIFAYITLCLCWSGIKMIENRVFFGKIVNIMAIGGRYTLYIFMYHLLVRDIMTDFFPVITENIWTLRVFTFVPMVVIPILVVYLVRRVKDKLMVSGMNQ